MSKPRRPAGQATTIGVTGGVASGKSEVTRRLAEHGAKVIDADRIGHEVLRLPDVKQALVRRWGQEIVDDRGEIDRRRVARIVFDGTPAARRELTFLEQVIHPRISERIEARLDEIAAEGSAPAIVLDAAVLLKAGWNEFCDVLLFVDCHEDLRRRRAAERGWSEAEFNRREVVQTPLGTKRANADEVIDNSGSLDALRGEVDRFWRRRIERRTAREHDRNPQ